MRFPLADWIDAHAACRHDLAQSGMHGEIRVPVPSARAIRDSSESALRVRLARRVGVHPSRLFLTHGATEGNALATLYLARTVRGHGLRCRVEFPEYPPMFDVARWAGFRLVDGRAAADLAIVSQPRNPCGDLWPPDRLTSFADGAESIVVDETFREFTTAPSVQRLGLRTLWTTGSFTKVYGADAVRVGFVVVPEHERDAFARFHGLVTDEIAPFSVASAHAILDHRVGLLRTVRGVFRRNVRAWRRATPSSPPLSGPTAFDTSAGPDGEAFARRCLRASVLVAPGSFFGRPDGVRVCLTRRTFPEDLVRYLEVRRGVGPVTHRASARAGSSSARRPPGSSALASAGRG